MKSKQKSNKNNNNLLKFKLILTNPPFEDIVNRKKTPHKLWIDFTHLHIKMLEDGGQLAQISPNSFLSPSSKILPYFVEYDVNNLNLDTSKFFDVGSTFADYIVSKSKTNILSNVVEANGDNSSMNLNGDIFYIPSDFCAMAMSIHAKVIFSQKNKLDVRYDYVTCHNVLIKNNDSPISKTKSKKFKYPIFHTNPQTWYSSIRQPFADLKKVLWTRSGYTKPFYDDGVMGGTDMAYYVAVDTKNAGINLANNLNSKLLQYILTTAKWSGFGNEKVFRALPNLPTDRTLDDKEMYDLFKLNSEEIEYVENYKPTKSEKLSTNGGGKLRDNDRVRKTGEVFTPDELADRLVNQIDMSILTDTKSKILESSAGNGQLVMALLRRMRTLGRTDWQNILENQLYVCEYMKDNIDELIDRISTFVGFDIHTIKHNIIWADFTKISSKNMAGHIFWSNKRYEPSQVTRWVELI